MNIIHFLKGHFTILIQYFFPKSVDSKWCEDIVKVANLGNINSSPRNNRKRIHFPAVSIQGFNSLGLGSYDPSNDKSTVLQEFEPLRSRLSSEHWLPNEREFIALTWPEGPKGWGAVFGEFQLTSICGLGRTSTNVYLPTCTLTHPQSPTGSRHTSTLCGSL